MLQTVGLITLLLFIATVCIFLIRFKKIRSNLYFFLFCFIIMLNELILYITAQFDINNHIMANVNTLTYYPMAVLLLFGVWESVKGKSKLLVFSKWSFVILIIAGWIAENFILETIYVFNSFLSSIISLIVVMISIYLINVLLFVKNNSIMRDSDGLLLIGMLIRSFSGGLLLLFLNYRMKYSSEFYGNILILVNFALIISTFFFLMSILCLPKNRKYTWPF